MSLADLVQPNPRLLITLDFIAETQAMTKHNIQRMYNDMVVRGIIWYRTDNGQQYQQYYKIYLDKVTEYEQNRSHEESQRDRPLSV
jgi:hypothetical protein